MWEFSLRRLALKWQLMAIRFLLLRQIPLSVSCTRSDQQSPLTTLMDQVTKVFRHSSLRATGIYASLATAAMSGVTTAETPEEDSPVP
jgi:hypothetical protein